MKKKLYLISVLGAVVLIVLTIRLQRSQTDAFIAGTKKIATSTVFVLFPIGGEAYSEGDDMAIVWWDDRDAGESDMTFIDTQRDGIRHQFHDGFNRSNGRDGTFMRIWKVANIPLGSYRLQICKSGTTECGISKGSFTIVK